MANIKRLPSPVLGTYAWQERGACRSTDPEQFFAAEAERGRSRSSRERAAKALCAVCPVLQACLDHAMAVREPYGVWGGTTPQERVHLARHVGAGVAV
ncbi:WhiB family transcriptional regulator [Pedococcus sp. 5OH_020]|uniref:WhiB family transcriptional regulator n=1 Tax=Pedococcus sp. 5OH_020 TaxID=2989814 RepID=UPI0022E9E7A5|nr:WhiB family transcriptional regulator [Pedococcus sp. 5OH_020]